MKTSHVLRAAFFSCLLIASIEQAGAWIGLGEKWPGGSEVVMQLGLGPTNLVLQDGFSSWNASAADAVDIWVGYLDFINFTSAEAPTVPQASGDGISSVFFSNTIFGDSFDESTLAVTVLNTTEDPKVTAEGDVVVNNAFQYDSYRGPQQSNARGDLYDFHRIILHELGHVLGLDHVEFFPPGQAIMEPIISDLDHLGGDDVLGVRALYGAAIFNLYGPLWSRVGDTFYNAALQSNNDATSFLAIGLPPGAAINPTTGEITGTATTVGDYNPIIIAHGPIADAYGSLQMTVWGLQGLLDIIRVGAFSVLADPIRPRLYAATETGINMIDTDDHTVTQVVPGEHQFDLLSLSADNSVLFARRDGGGSVVYRLDLESLQTLPDVPVPAGSSAFQGGLDGRAYVAGWNNVSQVDAETGEVQTTFALSSLATIAITPDRKILLVNDVGVSLSTYDVSTAVPALLTTSAGQFQYLTPSADSGSLFCVNYGTGTVRAPLPSLTPRESFADVIFVTSIAEAPDGSIFRCNTGEVGVISAYEPDTLQLTEKLMFDGTGPFKEWAPLQIVFDRTGPYFYAVMAGDGKTEIWKFATDFASYPLPAREPIRSLLNVSTRGRVGAGEEVMIGGFIVQGPDPKKVLVRGIGPSLPLTGALSNPVLDLYDSKGKLVATNDDWISNRLDILASHLAPSSERESAIVMTLDPGAYTAQVHDGNGEPGQALVEIYDLTTAQSLLANISTRGQVDAGDDVMIGGFIIGGVEATEVLLRAIGPSLEALGVTQPLQDPVLELHSDYGTVIATNDNWRSDQQDEILSTGLAPENDSEAAILATLEPGSFTAIVRDQGTTTGVGLVEVYNLSSAKTNR